MTDPRTKMAWGIAGKYFSWPEARWRLAGDIATALREAYEDGCEEGRQGAIDDYKRDIDRGRER